jgi:hypothetical protein
MLVACRPALRDRPFLSDRFFFVTARLFEGRRELSDADFRCLALASNRARRMHPYLLTAWVFLPDPAAAGHATCATHYPLTISMAIKPIKMSSMISINRWLGESDRLWQARLFDRGLRTKRGYNEKVEYIHLTAVQAGLVRSAQDWSRLAGSSAGEYSGMRGSAGFFSNPAAFTLKRRTNHSLAQQGCATRPAAANDQASKPRLCA